MHASHEFIIALSVLCISSVVETYHSMNAFAKNKLYQYVCL